MSLDNRDDFFLRELEEEHEHRPAEPLRRLWPLLPKVTIGDDESPSAGG